MRILASGKEIVDQYLAVNESRRIAYSFLSRAYEKEITVDFLEQLTKGNDFTSKISGLGGGKDLKEGFRLLSTYLKGLAERDLQEVKLELAVEYANLFLGVGGKVHHPSESAYRSPDHSIMQNPRDEVLSAYWDAGVDKVKKYTEPEDHIAIELQFMAYLCGKTADTLKKGQKREAGEFLKKQRDFINSHLRLWVTKFTEDVSKGASLDFYKGIAKITNGFIQLDEQAINDLIEEIQRL